MDNDLIKYNKDQRSTPFINEHFLANYPLNEHTIMEYFYMSHFYDSSSINQRCKMQKIDYATTKAQFKGIEFNLISASNPYIISMEVRKNPYETIVISYFYCLNGVIYQSPDLQSILLSNIKTIVNELEDITELINK